WKFAVLYRYLQRFQGFAIMLSVSNPARPGLHTPESPIEEEDDIGLTPITRPSTPLIPPRARFRPPDLVFTNDGYDILITPLASPSSPDLLDRVIFSPRTLTRSKTLSRL